MNDDKIEETIIERKANKDEVEWRSLKKLGSVLGDIEDVKRKIKLSNAAAAKMENLFFKKKAQDQKI